MGSISEKLEYLNETKTAIKTALINKGVSISDVDTFRSYADKIEDLEEIKPNLQAKTQTITSNTTTTITPDDGFDGLSSVAITTNVPNSNLQVSFGQAGEWISNKQYTIPATAKYAIISINWVKHHDTPDPTVSLTASKGSITNMDGTTLAWGEKDHWTSPAEYNGSNIHLRNYRKRFTNTTGQASTLTCNITSSYGLLSGNILIVY